MVLGGFFNEENGFLANSRDCLQIKKQKTFLFQMKKRRLACADDHHH